ncbi:MAG: GNAT family N-acetyltransferase [Pseudomonadota bacterium]
MRLTLMPLTERDLHELIDAPAAFARRHALTIAEGACAPAFIYGRALTNMQAAPEWAGVLSTRLYVLDGERVVVGSGGVKAPPLDDGEVEIGYGMAPAWQGRGLATQAARRLTDEALAHGASRVSAFTTPENAASWRLLQRIGFRRDGETVDPDDGLVWRWVHDRT